MIEMLIKLLKVLRLDGLNSSSIINGLKYNRTKAERAL